MIIRELNKRAMYKKIVESWFKRTLKIGCPFLSMEKKICEWIGSRSTGHANAANTFQRIAMSSQLALKNLNEWQSS